MENQEQEIWKDVVGYEQYYEVSNLGRIKTKPRKNGKGMYRGEFPKGSVGKKGYVYMKLSVNKKMKTVFLHRIVATAFLGESNLQVNHKDLNKKNNALSNLEYVTGKENILHGKLNGVIYSGRMHSVLATLKDGSKKEYMSIRDFSKENKMCRKTAALILKNKTPIRGVFLELINRQL